MTHLWVSVCYSVIFSSFIQAEIDYTIFEPVAVGFYQDYSSISILHFQIPEDTVLASWDFVGLQSTESCPSENIFLHLQNGGIPVVTPLNETFPDYFHIENNDMFNLNLKTSAGVTSLRVESPTPGMWYAILYRIGHGNVVKKITSKTCYYWIQSNLTTKSKVIKELEIDEQLLITLNEKYTSFKFHVSDITWAFYLAIDQCSSDDCSFTLETHSGSPLINSSDQSNFNSINCTGKSKCLLRVENPAVQTSTYILFGKTNLQPLNLTLRIVPETCSSGSPSASLKLLQSKHPILYSSSRTVSGECPSSKTLYRIAEVNSDFHLTYSIEPSLREFLRNVVTIHEDYPRIFHFNIMPWQDIGGTFRLYVKFNDTQSLTASNISVGVSICLQQSSIPVIGQNISCDEEHLMVIGSSVQDGIFRYIPYPRAGPWFLAMQSFCYLDENMSNRVKCDSSFKSTTVLFDANILPCVDGGCSNSGVCSLGIKGPIVYSYCHCNAGMRGMGCTDDSASLSSSKQLMFTLLLTLSNALFIVSITVAVLRRCYVEAFVYLANMFFSTFYHACDMTQWSRFTYCMMPYNVLSFCDFYASLMSFWVTLVAMAKLPALLYQLAHMVGALMLAIAVTWDEHGFVANLVPIAIGIAIVVLGWGCRCFKRKSCYPDKREWLQMVPGVILAVTGLCIFGLLETDENYPYTHSVWHICMAMSIVFFLPRVRQPKIKILTDSEISSDDELLDIRSGPSAVGLMPPDDMHNEMEDVSLQDKEYAAEGFLSIDALNTSSTYHDKDDVVLLD